MIKLDMPMERLKKHGKFPVSEGWDHDKRMMHNRQYGICAACCRSAAVELMDKDHIIPRFKGGSDDAGNLQLLCVPCNQLKLHYTMDQLATGLKKAWGNELHYHLRRTASDMYPTWAARYLTVKKPMYDFQYHLLVEMRDALPGWCRQWITEKKKRGTAMSYDDEKHLGYTRVFTYVIGTPLNPEPDHKYYAGLCDA